MTKKARVVKIHWEDHSCDLTMLSDGARLSGVQIMSTSASSNTGLNDLAAPGTSGNNVWDVSQRTGRDVIAIVGYCEGEPYVQGFLFPQICQMTFKEPNRKVDRHASDFYHTVDGKGNAEWYHPSGTYLRIGESPAHEDLTGKDFDGKWKVSNNTGTAPHVQLVVASGGAAKCTVNIDPGGNVTVTSVAAGKFVFPAGTEIDTPNLHCTGNIKADGEITDHTRSMQDDRDLYNGHRHGSSPLPDPQQ